MKVHVVGFIPPIIGVDDLFNTFRLGGFYAKHLLPGQEVYLLDEKGKIVFGRARVESIAVGSLEDMCLLHAHKNHTELLKDSATAPESLMRTLQKIYGPHIATVKRKTTVIFLKRLE